MLVCPEDLNRHPTIAAFATCIALAEEELDGAPEDAGPARDGPAAQPRDCERLSMELPQTARLLSAATRRYGARIDEIMLTSLALALLSGTEATRLVAAADDGPIRLANWGDEPGQQLRVPYQLRAAVREVRRQWCGWSEADGRAKMALDPGETPIWFNYHGSAVCRQPGRADGLTLSVHLNHEERESVLVAEWGWPADRHERGEVERIAECWRGFTGLFALAM